MWQTISFVVVLGLFMTAPCFAQPDPLKGQMDNAIVAAGAANVSLVTPPKKVPVPLQYILPSSFPMPTMTVAPVDDESDKLSPVEQEHLSTYCAALEARCLSNWEPLDSPSASKQVKVHFSVGAGGVFSDASLVHSVDSLQNEFAALDAIGESSSFREKDSGIRARDLEVTLVRANKKSNHDCAKESFRLHPGAINDGVVWHLIPMDVLNLMPELDPAIIHCPENLRLIKNKYYNSNDLQTLRTEWTFLIHHSGKLTLDLLRSRAAHIESKYSWIFQK